MRCQTGLLGTSRFIFWAVWEQVNTQLHLVSWEGTYQNDSTYIIFQPNKQVTLGHSMESLAICS